MVACGPLVLIYLFLSFLNQCIRKTGLCCSKRLTEDTKKHWLTDLGYSPEYGARPLKRVVQRELETPIARGIISGDVQDGDTLLVEADMAEKVLRIRPVRGEESSEPEAEPEGSSVQ